MVLYNKYTVTSPMKLWLDGGRTCVTVVENIPRPLFYYLEETAQILLTSPSYYIYIRWRRHSSASDWWLTRSTDMCQCNWQTNYAIRRIKTATYKEIRGWSFINRTKFKIVYWNKPDGLVHYTIFKTKSYDYF